MEHPVHLVVLVVSFGRGEDAALDQLVDMMQQGNAVTVQVHEPAVQLAHISGCKDCLGRGHGG